MSARAIGAFLRGVLFFLLPIAAYGVRMMIKRLSRYIDVFPCSGIGSVACATTSPVVRIKLLQAAI